MNKFSERRLKENEIIFREANKSVSEFVEEETGRQDHMLPFYCECSIPECKKRIKLSTRRFRELHQNNRQFIVINEHQVPAIEKIVRENGIFSVVEKFGKMPSVSEIDHALSNIEL